MEGNNDKRLLISLLLVLCLLAVPVQGQESKEENITMEDIVKANRLDEILENHDSVQKDIDGQINYASDGIRYLQFEVYDFLVDADDNWMYTDIEGEKRLVYYWYAMSEEEKKEQIITLDDYSEILIMSSFTLLEEIENIEMNDDGTVTVTAILDSEHTKDALEQDPVDYPEEYYTYEMKNVYTLDQESDEILALENYLLAPDEEIPLISYVAAYDADQPEPMKTMTGLIEEFKNGERKESRTITVIYDAGTDDEETYEITMDPRFMCQPIFKPGYEYLYNDPEKTTPYTGGDGVSDWTIYAFAEE